MNLKEFKNIHLLPDTVLNHYNDYNEINTIYNKITNKKSIEIFIYKGDEGICIKEEQRNILHLFYSTSDKEDQKENIDTLETTDVFINKKLGGENN